MTGTIVGVEARRPATPMGGVDDEHVLNLLTGATIRAIDLKSISSLSLDDPQLQDELTKALTALVQARDQDKKPVTINFSGTGDRHVRIGYVVETPVWKTSYRLILGDKGEPTRLQGWAIVENQTESDWNGVSLSLVSGRPISFMMDLYQPLYATRPTVVPQMYSGLRPQVYDAGLDARRDTVGLLMRTAAAPAPQNRVSESLANSGRPLGARMAPNTAALSEVVVTGTTGINPLEGVDAVARAANLGALFQYTVGNVTLARQKSAMLPIIADSIRAERVSIYNASVLSSNPLNGVELHNTTGKHLLQGPVTVLDAGGYAGDARIDDVPPGQQRLLSYGIDLDMHVDLTKHTETDAVVTAKIVEGLLMLSHKFVASQTYATENKSDKAKTLIIEHPIRQGWKLAKTPDPVETTPNFYRFKGSAAPNKITTFTVTEELVTQESMAVLTADVDGLAVYSRTGEIPADVRAALTKAIHLKQDLLVLLAQFNDCGRKIAEIATEQNRLRENMKTVAPTTDYYQRLLAKLNEQESSIEALQKQRDEVSAKQDLLRKQFSDYLDGLTVG